jgi:hypothetical protein
MSTRTLVAAAAVVVTMLSPLAAGDAFAQDRVAPGTGTLTQTPDVLTLPSETMAAAAAEPQIRPIPPSTPAPTPIQRPELPTKKPGTSGGMMALYASTVAVQAMDLHSTMTGIKAGASEGNPLMGGATKNAAVFIGVKAAVTAGTIFAAQKLAKRNKPAAIAMLIAVNSAYAMIAVHNYRVAGSLK